MIVWGGSAAAAALNNGGRYNPAANSWTAVSTTGAPAARYYHTAVWTRQRDDRLGRIRRQAFERRRPLQSRGQQLDGDDCTGAPAARCDHTAVWTGSEMIVWGGSTAPAL